METAMLQVWPFLLAMFGDDCWQKDKGRETNWAAPCSLGLSATRQQYFSLRTNQPPARVYRTGGNWSGNRGNRSYRSGLVPVPAGSQPVQIQNLNLNSKNEKVSQNSQKQG
jgi:hypothetical protein